MRRFLSQGSFRSCLLSLAKPFLVSLLLAACLFTGPAALVAEETQTAPQVVVVGPQQLLTAMKSWIDWRTQQGYQIHTLATESLPVEKGFASPDSIRTELRKLSSQIPLSALVLAGSARPGTGGIGHVPAPLLESIVVKNYGPDEPIASDTWYTDMDDDGWPDLAVGRLPADSPAEMTALVNRVMAYESCPAGLWQRRVNLVAGMGGFSPVIDKAIEMVVRRIFFDTVQSDLDLAITQANWRSPFCPAPPHFSDVVTSCISQGSIFFLYVGHGLPDQLDYVTTPQDDHYPIFDVTNVPALTPHTDGAPIAFLFSCYSGASDFEQKTLGEELLLAPGGPIAVLSGSRTTMPYGMAVLGIEMLQMTSHAKGRTRSHLVLGNVILDAKRKMVIDMTLKPSERKDEEKNVRTFIDDTARIFDPSAKYLDGQLFDHVHLMGLLGDPLTRIRFADELTVTAPETVYAGEEIPVRVAFAAGQPIPGEFQGTAELVLGPGRTAVSRMSRKEYKGTEEELEEFQKTYLAANERVVATVPLHAKGEEYEAVLPVPADCFGPYTVRVFLAREQESGSGSSPIHVRASSSSARP